MAAKTKMNSVLEKKVEELEKKVEEYESLLETTTLNDTDPNLYRDIQLRIIFANTLLAAEISSQSIDVNGEEDDEESLKFASMAKRLTELAEVFDINQTKNIDDALIKSEVGRMDTDVGVVNGETGLVFSLVESCLNESIIAEEEKEVEAEQWSLFEDALIEPEVGSLETEVGVVNDETGLVFSLVDSCLNESIIAEEEKEKEQVEAEQWPLFEDALSEEKTEVTFPVVMAVKEEPVVKEKGWMGYRTLVCFGLTGLVCGVIGLFGYISLIMEDNIVFPTPT